MPYLKLNHFDRIDTDSFISEIFLHKEHLFLVSQHWLKNEKILLIFTAYLGEMKGLAEGLCGSEACRGLMGWKLKWRFLVDTARLGL